MFHPYPLPAIAVLPLAPKNGSPVPELTSLYHRSARGPYGSSSYPGNCSGELIKDLLRYFRPKHVLDPMTGSGTCGDVCDELRICHYSDDLRTDFDASDPRCYPPARFDFIWLHPPYWRMKRYSDDPRDLSNAPTIQDFLTRYKRVIENCEGVLDDGGKLAVLMGDYSDVRGYLPLTFYTKQLAFGAGLRQACTDIIRFSHGASSSKKKYHSSFIPGLHDVCMIFEKA